MILLDAGRFFFFLCLLGIFTTIFQCEIDGEPLYDPNYAEPSVQRIDRIDR